VHRKQRVSSAGSAVPQALPATRPGYP